MAMTAHSYRSIILDSTIPLNYTPNHLDISMLCPLCFQVSFQFQVSSLTDNYLFMQDGTRIKQIPFERAFFGRKWMLQGDFYFLPGVL